MGLLNGFKNERLRILLIAGGLDACGRNLDELLRESRHKGVEVQWELVGLGLTSDEKDRVRALPHDVTVHIADTSEELDEAFRFVLYEGPIRAEIDVLYGFIFTDVRVPLNEARNAAGSPPSRRTAEARSKVAELRNILKSGAQRFDNFPTEGELSAFASVKQLLKDQFDNHYESVEILDVVLDFDEKHPGELDDKQIEERNILIASYTDLVDEFNERNVELAEALEDALNKLFGPS